MQRYPEEFCFQIARLLWQYSFASLRLRASLFVNLVAMRSCMSRRRNAVGFLLSEHNLAVLQRCNFLMHCAHAGSLANQISYSVCEFHMQGCIFLNQGLAREAIENGDLLWKIRPKHHQFPGM